MNETTERFDTWALVEIMGHKQLAGRVSETTLAGAGMLRVDVLLCAIRAQIAICGREDCRLSADRSPPRDPLPSPHCVI